MRRETRTTLQIDADRLDLEIFRVVAALEGFADRHRMPDAKDAARAIDGMRHRIRRHMHRADQKETIA